MVPLRHLCAAVITGFDAPTVISFLTAECGFLEGQDARSARMDSPRCSALRRDDRRRQPPPKNRPDRSLGRPCQSRRRNRPHRRTIRSSGHTGKEVNRREVLSDGEARRVHDQFTALPVWTRTGGAGSSAAALTPTSRATCSARSSAAALAADGHHAVTHRSGANPSGRPAILVLRRRCSTVKRSQSSCTHIESCDDCGGTRCSSEDLSELPRHRRCYADPAHAARHVPDWGACPDARRRQDKSSRVRSADGQGRVRRPASSGQHSGRYRRWSVIQRRGRGAMPA